MKKITENILLIMVLLLTTLSLSAQSVYKADEVPNVNKADRREYVSDPAAVVPSGVKNRVNMRLDSLRKATSIEFTVVVVPSIGDETIEDFSEEIFTSWGIGKKDKDNGVLLVLVPEDRKVRIETGYGVEGALPDIACKRIIQNAVVPAMREDNIGEALDASTKLISAALTDPSVAEELRSEQPDATGDEINTLPKEVLFKFAKIVIGIVFIFMLVMFIIDLITIRRRDNYSKALAWRSHLTMYFLGALFSLGLGLPFALLALFFYRSYRTRRIKCDTCGTKMNRMSEEEDNKYLSLSQDLEEQLKTVDYDVWVCPKCGTIERIPYKERQTKYTECPKCHTVAMHLKCDKIIVPPTTRSEGVGERIYECEFCHHQHRERYKIPRKDDGTGLLAAGAILGSGLGRGGDGFGGGGFGGGFGGGSTGGGGASGSW